MTASPSEPRPRLTFGLATLLILTATVAGEYTAIKHAEEWGEFPAAAICLVAGSLIGLIELRHARGFGTLRGRLFRGAFGGMAGGGVFAVITITLEWIALADWPAPWTTLAVRFGTWLLWGGLAGGVLGALVDLVRAPRRKPQLPRGDQRAGEFLASLPTTSDVGEPHD